MTSETLFEALTDVRNDFIQEASAPAPRHNLAIRYSLAAACATIIAFAAGLPHLSNPKHPMPPTIADTEAAPPTIDDTETAPQTQDTHETESKPWVDETLPKLPLPDLSASAGFGDEGYLAFSADELSDTRPWDETVSLATMPVFKNPIPYSGAGEYLISDQEMLERLTSQVQEIARRMGIDNQLSITEKWEKNYNGDQPDREQILGAIAGETDSVTILADSLGILSVCFTPPRALPEPLGKFHTNPSCSGWDSAAPEELAAIGKYIADEYAGLLNMTAPTAAVRGGDYSISPDPESPDCRKEYSLQLYDGSGDIIAQLLSRDIGKATVLCDKEGNVSSIRFYPRDLSEKLGDYPILTPDEARAQLCAGNYLPQGTYEMPGEAYIVKTELLYRTGILEEYFIPYYRFLVELPDHAGLGWDAYREMGLKYYHAYYVPAVRPEYFTGLPATWHYD